MIKKTYLCNICECTSSDIPLLGLPKATFGDETFIELPFDDADADYHICFTCLKAITPIVLARVGDEKEKE